MENGRDGRLQMNKKVDQRELRRIDSIRECLDLKQ